MSGRFSIVLSGGGCKAFWANGVLRSISASLPPIEHWAGASAGAAFALTQVSGRFEDTFTRFLQSVAANQRNFYLDRALRAQRPFPHDEIYRDAVRFVLRDRGFDQVREGAPVHILLSYVEAGHPFVSTSWAAVRAFADRRRRGVLHGPRQLPPGLGLEVVSSHEAQSVQQLLDWTLMSSTIPPITPIQRRAGRRYLDGGLIDNVPIRALPEPARGPGSRVLCLVSHHVRVPERPVQWVDGAMVLYLAARAPLPVRVWDYTSPERVIAAIELGARDGMALLDRVHAFVGAATHAKTG
ncbi:patatin-like phospholipase family protein [Enhygromyxa salina]|uniref:Patatin-like phospholipase n=1 Tax=Enhygromyxa salina TaxID=215803 RepID=A0A2S9YFK2_9BACT|nr:patatin-like phospholipase family protein [Enhygromyxa salina]PRQ03786.1 Patatin-like phospholipase [Enhygromyxa salina]